MTLLLMVTGYPTDTAISGSSLFDEYQIKLFDDEVLYLLGSWYLGMWR